MDVKRLAVFKAVLVLMKNKTEWRGTPKELTDKLKGSVDGPVFNVTCNSMSRFLNDIKGELEKNGIKLFTARSNHRLIVLKNLKDAVQDNPASTHEGADKGSEVDEEQELTATQETVFLENERLLRELDAALRWRDAMIEVARSSISKIPIPKRLPDPPAPKTDYSHENMVALFGDSQIGEEVSLTDTSGINVYNFDTFRQEITLYVDKIIKIYNLHKKMYPIPRLYFLGLGDFVEGELIYRGQAFHLCMNLLDQVIAGSAYLAEQMARLAQVVPEIVGIGVGGNHGRPTNKKGESSNDSLLDHLFWKIVAMRLDGFRNVKWITSGCTSAKLMIEDSMFLLHHGDSFKSWMNIPFYGFDRWTRNQAHANQTFFDYVIVGHHHRSCSFDVGFSKAIINGSFVGGSGLSVEMMSEANAPKQLIFGVKKDVGQTWQYDILVNPSWKAGLQGTPDSNGIITPNDGGQP